MWGIEKVINARNGYLMVPGNIDELVTFIILALTDIKKNEKGVEAYRTIRDIFDIDNSISLLTELYKVIY